MSASRTAYISAGSNLGNRQANLLGGLRALAKTPDVRVEAISSIYETDPVGGVPQPAYLNLAARLSTTLSPEALLDVLQKTERSFGRNRATEIRWGPRTLDLDLLMLGEQTLATKTLTLPHPRMWERMFVMIPLREVAKAELAKKLASISPSDVGVRRVRSVGL